MRIANEDDIKHYNPVSLEQAKQLKRKGYTNPCSMYYLDSDKVPYVSAGLKIADSIINHNNHDHFVYSAPSVDDPLVKALLKSYTVLDGVKEYEEHYDVELQYQAERPVVVAFNEGYHNQTKVDLIQLLKWVKNNKPELMG